MRPLSGRERPSFYFKERLNGIEVWTAAFRHLKADTCRYHTIYRQQSSLQFLKCRYRIPILFRRLAYFKRKDALRIESSLGLLQAPKGLHQKSRADEQDHGERDLPDCQQACQTFLFAISGNAML